MKLSLIVMATLLLAQGALAAQQRPAVVELFTSQGCSSCPPADAFLGELSKRSDVVALAYHVDYWDYIGWKDRFALPEGLTRQKGYRDHLSLRTLYTPQMVIDGVHDLVGSDRTKALSWLEGRREGVGVGLTASTDQLVVDIEAGSPTHPADIVLVTYLPAAQTPVGRGENDGRRLQEFNIVRSLSLLGQWNGHAKRLSISRNALPLDAKAAALFVQEAGQGAILGAAALRYAE